jgi:hypothetical protein
MTTTPLELLECEQGSELWLQARCGLVTASRCADVTAMTKKGESAARRNYRTEILCEILTGQPYPQFVSREMLWGRDNEKFARAAYEMQRDVMVETAGFVLHPDISRFGCSPDGLVGADGMVQIKCPNTSTHIGWLLDRKVPLEHMPQMLAEMSCTGRGWCDFVSYDPRLPEHLQLFIHRFERDPKLIEILEGEVVHFNSEIANLMSQLPGGPQLVVATLDQAAEDERDWY